MCFMSNDIDILRPKLKLFMRSGMNTQTIIESKLTELLSPTFLTVENESHMHSVPPNSETHFKVTVASEEFTGKRLIQRHRAINKALADELAGGVHALAIHAYTPEEWREEKGEQAPNSPKCLGGSLIDKKNAKKSG